VDFFCPDLGASRERCDGDDPGLSKGMNPRIHGIDVQETDARAFSAPKCRPPDIQPVNLDRPR